MTDQDNDRLEYLIRKVDKMDCDLDVLSQEELNELGCLLWRRYMEIIFGFPVRGRG